MRMKVSLPSARRLFYVFIYKNRIYREIFESTEQNKSLTASNNMPRGMYAPRINATIWRNSEYRTIVGNGTECIFDAHASCPSGRGSPAEEMPQETYELSFYYTTSERRPCRARLHFSRPTTLRSLTDFSRPVSQNPRLALFPPSSLSEEGLYNFPKWPVSFFMCISFCVYIRETIVEIKRVLNSLSNSLEIWEL